MRAKVVHNLQLSPKLILSQTLDQIKSEVREYGPPDICFYFSSVEVPAGLVLKALKAEFPTMKIVGCSSFGQMSSMGDMAEDASVLSFIWIGKSAKVHLHCVEMNHDSFTANVLAEKISTFKSVHEASPFSAMILFSAFPAHDEEATRIVQSTFPGVPLFGGVAGDNWTFKEMQIYHEDQVLKNAMVLVSFSGAIEISHGVATGFEAHLLRKQVTKAVGSRIYEIDSRPALEYYRKSFSDSVKINSEIPLAVFESEKSSGGFYLRDPLSVDDSDGSLTFAGEIPVGSWVSFARTKEEDMIAAAERSLASALGGLSSECIPKFSLCISCAGRKILLGSQAKRESELIHKAYPDIPSIGFYSYGEISPLKREDQTKFHNQTFVSLVFGERRAA